MNNASANQRRKTGTTVSLIGIFANLALFGGKFLAGVLSGSISIRADAVTPGRVLDIDPTGGLVVEREDGSIEVIHSGEVSLRT